MVIRLSRVSYLLFVFVSFGCLSGYHRCDESVSLDTNSDSAKRFPTLRDAQTPETIYQSDVPNIDSHNIYSEVSTHSDITFDLTARVDEPNRLIAIGDLHGDTNAARNALRLAGAIDEQSRWIGGDLAVVQVGDLIDRGGQDREVIELMQYIKRDARHYGGELYLMNGNHEIMNVCLDFGYVHVDAWDDFDDIEYDPTDQFIESFPAYMRGRVAAFYPGGPLARLLARQRIVLITKDTVFVHGSLLPEHVAYGVDRINREVSEWMLGRAYEPLEVIGSGGPMWLRTYAYEVSQKDCEMLEGVLESLSVERMVIAHTVQYEGITSACKGKVWRIDTGMSDYYGGNVSVLQISDEGVSILTWPPNNTRF